MKKAIFLALSLAYSGLSFAMDTTLDLFPNPDAGAIIGINRSVIARINKAKIEKEPLFDQDSSALKSVLAQSLKYDLSVQLLTVVNPQGLAYINLIGESAEITSLTTNPYVQFYQPYESPDEMGQYIAQQMKKDRKQAKATAYWKGCATGTGISVILGCMAALLTSMSCNQ